MAFLLAETSELRFQPANDLPEGDDGTASLTYLAWDQTQGTAESTYAISATGGSSAFSTSSSTASMTVTYVTRAPSWTAGITASFPPVLGYSASNPNPDPAGSTVASIFGEAFSDAPGFAAGIAVPVTTGTAGTWQYSINGGTSWQNFPGVSTKSALLLSANSLIRFLPRSEYSGTVTLTAYAWDGSTGNSGETVSLSGKNAAGAFSATTLTATCLVNTAPTLGS
jgi:hypothetical protein